MATSTRILIYEDNNDLRTSLSQLLAGAPGLELVGALGRHRGAAPHQGRRAGGERGDADGF
jgi:hypothetical protein